ncbi:hypothetical protein [Mycolicibacterium porcinum]|uniref:Lipoprotein n=1 Tax=Mycolicibacterium porcinum TaxID=39693 RepID=A0ABV3VLC7_9MYCO
MPRALCILTIAAAAGVAIAALCVGTLTTAGVAIAVAAAAYLADDYAKAQAGERQ